MDREAAFIIAIAILFFILRGLTTPHDQKIVVRPKPFISSKENMHQKPTTLHDRNSVQVSRTAISILNNASPKIVGSNSESSYPYTNSRLHQKRTQVISSIDESIHMIDKTLEIETTRR
jgi:hypothetical protein